MDSTGDLLMAAARTLRRRYAHAMHRWDISPSQARALRVIVSEEDALRLSALAERLNIVPRSATEVVDALEKRDLVARQADPTDRRATGVTATAKGVDLMGHLDAARADAADDYLSALSKADRKELDRILEILLT